MASFVRCWLIRGLIVAVLAAGGFGAWVVVNWVSPEKVRAAVEEHVRSLVGESVEVKVESAAVRIFGGIRVTNLTLTRVGETTPFVTVPSAVIYHDKQEFNRGKLSVRKVELDAPTVRLTRRVDGSWDLPKFPDKEGAADRAAPTVVLRDATVLLTDADPDGFPPLALKNVKLHLVNDPVAVLKVDGQCSALPAGELDEAGRFDPNGFVIPLTVTAKWDLTAKQFTAHLDIPDVLLRPELAPTLARFHPEAVRVVGGLSGRIGVKLDVTSASGGGTAPPAVAVRVDLRDCRYEDDRLPKPIEHVAGSIRLQNGRVSVDKLTGKLGTAAVELHLETKPLFGPAPPQFGPRLRPLTALAQLRPPPHPLAAGDPREQVERRLERLDLTVRGLSLDDEMVAKLAPDGEKWKREFRPVGGIDVRVAFTRPDGGWRREVDVIPNRASVTYDRFRYPFTDLDGRLKSVTASDGTIPAGAIFCLRAVNQPTDPNYPLHPHYLVQVADDGTVVHPHTQAKHSLDVLRKLCSGRSAPDAAATARFDKLTRQGEKMDHYQTLLAAAFASVSGKQEERAAASLFTPGGTHAHKADTAGEFEVLAWLAVLPAEATP